MFLHAQGQIETFPVVRQGSLKIIALKVIPSIVSRGKNNHKQLSEGWDLVINCCSRARCKLKECKAVPEFFLLEPSPITSLVSALEVISKGLPGISSPPYLTPI